MSDEIPNITIYMDRTCKRCGDKMAAENGYCLRCLTDYITNGNKFPPLKRKKKR